MISLLPRVAVRRRRYQVLLKCTGVANEKSRGSGCSLPLSANSRWVVLIMYRNVTICMEVVPFARSKVHMAVMNWASLVSTKPLATKISSIFRYFDFHRS